MDRDDARFVAAALTSRISGDREALDQLAALSCVRLVAASARLSSLADEWPPALLAANELRVIAHHGSAAADTPVPPELQIFVDNLRELVAEPAAAPPRNRFEKRRQAKIVLPRRARIQGRVPVRIH